MSDETGWIYDLDKHQMQDFDPRKWGWNEVLPYGHEFPESIGWGMPFWRNFMNDGEGNRLIVEWECTDTMNRLYLNGKKQEPYTYNQVLQIVRDKKSLH